MALQKRLTGIILNREEVILVEPDSEFFLELASKYGKATDKKFFELYRATYPDGVWPIYLEQMTDSQGCTAFGAGNLVKTYERWTGFRRSHPTRYRAEVDRLIEDVEQWVAGTCACTADRDAVLRELEDFAAKFPKSPAHDAVVLHIGELKSGESNFRFNCSPG